MSNIKDVLIPNKNVIYIYGQYCANILDYCAVKVPIVVKDRHELLLQLIGQLDCWDYRSTGGFVIVFDSVCGH